MDGVVEGTVNPSALPECGGAPPYGVTTQRVVGYRRYAERPPLFLSYGMAFASRGCVRPLHGKSGYCA